MVTRDKRNFGIDLLRIIAMVMVVSHHFLGHGGVLDSVNEFSFNWFCAWIMRSVCYVSVTLFYLISAYFQSEKTMGIVGIVRIWIEVIFYSIVMYAVSIIAGFESFSIQGVVKAIFPVLFRQYGFFNGYLLLIFLSPFLNSAVHAMGKNSTLDFWQWLRF